MRVKYHAEVLVGATFPWLSSSYGSGRPEYSLGLPYRLT